MCGIAAYVGPRDPLAVVIDGLRRLEYRGYDSAGIAVQGERLAIARRAGRLSRLEEVLDDLPSERSVAAMGHTRWATHGAPTDANAHPHRDCTGRIAVIHNGIVENHAELRTDLEERGHVLASETDTECVAHLVEDADGTLAERVRSAVAQLRGAYSLVVMSEDEPGTIVGVRVASPLVVGLGEGENLLASDIPALLASTRLVAPLEEGRVVEVRADGVVVTDLDGAPADLSPFEATWDVGRAEKGGYDAFMRKEIDEQPAAIRDTLAGRLDATGRVRLDEVRLDTDLLASVDKVFVVACGTAFHSGLVGRYAIEHRTRLPVEIDIASEFRYRDPVLGPATLTLAVSQSGETIDTLEAVRHARRQGSRVLAVTNTVGSSIAREADAVLYTHGGPEVSVASTKTFATQMVALHLVSLLLADLRRTMFPEEIAEAFDRLRELPDEVARTLRLEEQVVGIAERLRDAPAAIFMGRHTGYPAALEGALKLKEVAYVHAHGYAAGELKHGPIALIEEGTPVVAVATDGHVRSKMLSNIHEVRARGAEVIAIATEGDREVAGAAQHVIEVPRTPDLLAPVVVTPPLQLLAYHVARLRGLDVDRPRNLAKSVTVE